MLIKLSLDLFLCLFDVTDLKLIKIYKDTVCNCLGVGISERTWPVA